MNTIGRRVGSACRRSVRCRLDDVAAERRARWSMRRASSVKVTTTSSRRCALGSRALRRCARAARGETIARRVAMSAERAPSVAERLQPRVDACNEITAADYAKFIPFVVDGQSVGALQPWFAEELLEACGPGTLRRDEGGAVVFVDGLDTPDARSEALKPGLLALRDNGTITGWRDEIFPVTMGYGVPPLLRIERAAASLLGVRAYGVHVNGFVTLPNGEKELWVGKRAKNKQTFPSKLDHLVAGGLPDGMPPSECVVKECAEEASVPEHLARNAKAVNVVSYSMNYNGCCKRDVLFCYDLELPLDFVPTPDDGEVESFERFPIAKVLDVMMTTEDFKPNCCLVIIDFCVRHGYLTPDEPGYVRLVQSLRVGND